MFDEVGVEYIELTPAPAAEETPASDDGRAEATSEIKKTKTRRGTRGGRGRKRKPLDSSPEAGQESPLV